MNDHLPMLLRTTAPSPSPWLFANTFLATNLGVLNSTAVLMTNLLWEYRAKDFVKCILIILDVNNLMYYFLRRIF